MVGTYDVVSGLLQNVQEKRRLTGLSSHSSSPGLIPSHHFQCLGTKPAHR